MKLMDHLVVIFYNILRNISYFTKLVTLDYFPTNREQGFPFLHILTNIYYFCLLTIALLKGVRAAKTKGEKERYAHLNAEFQRIARRDKKAFHSDQCKEIEENNRMGKIRDLLKKIRDTKGIFHEKIGTIKDRNGMDLTGTEDINKRRRQEYTEELYKKISQ